MAKVDWTEKTVKKSPIPGFPDNLPQQRLVEVVEMPTRPEGFETGIGMTDPYPPGCIRAPRRLLMLGGVEWAWSPAHSRIDTYYLNEKRNHWVLWIHWLNDDEFPWKWEWWVYAFAPKVKADERTVAMHLLKDAWAYDEAHNSVDHYHWIGSTGALSVSDFEAVAREVW